MKIEQWIEDRNKVAISGNYEDYKKYCKKYNTPITILFHNSSFDNYHWKGWKELYTKIINIHSLNSF